MTPSIFYCDISQPPRRVNDSFSFLQQTQRGLSGSFSSWLGCLLKLALKSLSQLLSSFFTFFFSFASPSTLIVSMYCSRSTFLVLFMSDSSSPNFLKASFNRLPDYFSIHSATVLYLGGSGLEAELSLADPSLRTEKESLCELVEEFLLMLFSCLMSPSSSLTLGLHSKAIFSVLVKRSQTVEVISSFKMSNYICSFKIL